MDHSTAVNTVRFCRCAFPSALLSVLLVTTGCNSFGRRGPSEAEIAATRQLSQQGLAAIDRGDWNAAELALHQAVQQSPTDWQARALYAEALWRRGAGQQAMAQLASLPDLNATDATSAVRMGRLLLEMNEHDIAGLLADQALEMNPQLAAAWALQGRVAKAEGDVDQALASLNRALDFEPRDEAAIRDVAELYRSRNQPERALAAVQQWTGMYPPGEEPQEALYLQGLALSALQRDADAVDSFRAAVSRGSPRTEMLFALAQAEMRTGNTFEAERSLRYALQIDAGHGPSLALLKRIETGGRGGNGTILQ